MLLGIQVDMMSDNQGTNSGDLKVELKEVQDVSDPLGFQTYVPCQEEMVLDSSTERNRGSLKSDNDLVNRNRVPVLKGPFDKRSLAAEVNLFSNAPYSKMSVDKSDISRCISMCDIGIKKEPIDETYFQYDNATASCLQMAMHEKSIISENLSMIPSANSMIRDETGVESETLVVLNDMSLIPSTTFVIKSEAVSLAEPPLVLHEKICVSDENKPLTSDKMNCLGGKTVSAIDSQKLVCCKLSPSTESVDVASSQNGVITDEIVIQDNVPTSLTTVVEQGSLQDEEEDTSDGSVCNKSPPPLTRNYVTTPAETSHRPPEIQNVQIHTSSLQETIEQPVPTGCFQNASVFDASVVSTDNTALSETCSSRDMPIVIEPLQNESLSMASKVGRSRPSEIPFETGQQTDLSPKTAPTAKVKMYLLPNGLCKLQVEGEKKGIQPEMESTANVQMQLLPNGICTFIKSDTPKSVASLNSTLNYCTFKVVAYKSENGSKWNLGFKLCQVQASPSSSYACSTEKIDEICMPQPKLQNNDSTNTSESERNDAGDTNWHFKSEPMPIYDNTDLHDKTEPMDICTSNRQIKSEPMDVSNSINHDWYTSDGTCGSDAEFAERGVRISPDVVNSAKESINRYSRVKGVGKKKTPKKTYLCPICARIIEGKSEFKKHRKIHMKNTTYFSYDQNGNDIPSFVCKVCDVPLESRKKLKQHMDMDHPGESDTESDIIIHASHRSGSSLSLKSKPQRDTCFIRGRGRPSRYFCDVNFPLTVKNDSTIGKDRTSTKRQTAKFVSYRNSLNTRKEASCKMLQIENKSIQTSTDKLRISKGELRTSTDKLRTSRDKLRTSTDKLNRLNALFERQVKSRRTQQKPSSHSKFIEDEKKTRSSEVMCHSYRTRSSSNQECITALTEVTTSAVYSESAQHNVCGLSNETESSITHKMKITEAENVSLHELETGRKKLCDKRRKRAKLIKSGAKQMKAEKTRSSEAMRHSYRTRSSIHGECLASAAEPTASSVSVNPVKADDNDLTKNNESSITQKIEMLETQCDTLSELETGQHRQSDKRQTNRSFTEESDDKSELNTKSEIYHCIMCSFKCNVPSRMTEHESGHKGPFKCKRCDYVSKYKHYLKSHFKKKHIIRSLTIRYDCSVCKFSTEKLSELHDHEKEHVNLAENPFLCEACGFTTRWAREVRKHQDMHLASPSQYFCDRCNFTSDTARALRLHKHSHLADVLAEMGATIHKCNLCAFRTTDKACLAKHRDQMHPRTKRGRKPKAEEKKPRRKKKFYTCAKREYHKIKRLTCEDCGYRCYCMSRLNSHKLCWHSDVKPYQCPQCHYSTTHPYAFKEHIEKKHGSNPHKKNEGTHSKFK